MVRNSINMAAIHKLLAAKSNLQLLTTCARRSLSSKNTYLRKYKHRRNHKISDLDIEDILYNRTTGDLATTTGTTATAQLAPETTNGSWHNSKERLKSLKTSEKIVAAIAVVTMLLGYFGIKWMVSVPPSRKTEEQETESSDAVPQPAT